MSEEKLVPKLRFSGFNDEWYEFKLNDISERITRKNKKLETNRPLTISAQYGLVDQIEYFDKIVASDSLINYYLLYNGEFAYNKSYSNGYPFGAVKRLDNYEHGAISTLYICFKVTDKMNSDFLNEYFETDKWYKEIYKIAVEGARNHGLLNIAVGDFFNTKHILPTNPKEQEKLAKFFIEINRKIGLLEKKHQAFLDFKKYLMQQIFTQKLRFANFNKKWIKYQFKDLGIVKSGVGFSKKYQGHLNLDYNLYKVSDMNLKVNKKYMVKSNNTVDNFILKDMNTKLIEKPSIIFAKVGEAIFLNRKRIVINPFLIDNNMMAFSPNNKVNLEFIYYLSLTINFGKYAQIGALPSYNASDIYSIKCEIPSIEEQEKISSILSLVDEKIDYIKSYINNIITFKKGLLQQMFV